MEGRGGMEEEIGRKKTACEKKREFGDSYCTDLHIKCIGTGVGALALD